MKSTCGTMKNYNIDQSDVLLRFEPTEQLDGFYTWRIILKGYELVPKYFWIAVHLGILESREHFSNSVVVSGASRTWARQCHQGLLDQLVRKLKRHYLIVEHRNSHWRDQLVRSLVFRWQVRILNITLSVKFDHICP